MKGGGQQCSLSEPFYEQVRGKNSRHDKDYQHHKHQDEGRHDSPDGLPPVVARQLFERNQREHESILGERCLAEKQKEYGID